MLEPLLALAAQKYDLELTSSSSWTDFRNYLQWVKDEILEIESEIKHNNHVYLEDECGDLLRDYINLLYTLQQSGYIGSVTNVFLRAKNKYTERVADQKSGVSRSDTKKRQKERLDAEHATI